MKISKILSVFMFMLAFVMIFAFSVNAEAASDTVYYQANAENEATVVYPQIAPDGKTYLFLPSSADLSALTLDINGLYDNLSVSADKSVTVAPGEAIDILSLFDDADAQNGEYTVTVSAAPKVGIVYTKIITIMKSENVKALYLVSDDPENEGREWVDTSKSNKATGKMALVNPDGTIFHEDTVTELKARGNSTFTDFEKKAYQIKIKNKTSLAGEDNKTKKWVLLANAADVTLIHNSLVTALAEDLGLPYTVEGDPIDLYYDGEYRGSYLITDKVEVDGAGVDIQDLDSIIEDLNEGTDAYEDPVVVTKTTASKGEEDAEIDSAGSYKYVDGLTEPELEEGTSHFGYLLELDFIYRYPDEQSGFVTERGQAVVTKDPEYLTKETGAYISQFFQEFEDAVFNNGYNEETGKYYYEYCDLDSLVNIYLINEFTKNYDSFRSSAFFYLPADEDIMYAGPIWDFDLSFTTGYDYNSQIAGNAENFFAVNKYMLGELIEIESFRDAVKAKLDKDNGEFYLAVQNMLGEDGNIMTFSDTVYASQKMNYKLWDITHDETAAFRCGDEETYENAVDFLYDWVETRINWLADITSTWEGENYSVPKDPVKWSANTRYHNLITVEEKEVTCTEDGYTESVVCADCGKVFTAAKVIKATGHTYGFSYCTQEKACKICGETTPGKEHSWMDATCEMAKHCKLCGITTGEPIDHKYEIDSEDSRNSETCIVYKCTSCGKEMLVNVQPKPKYEPGDINMDGKVNAADARIALRIAASLETADGDAFELGDMNADGKINASDARLILRKSAQLDQ